MSYFTEVFHALDYDNKGYILFDEFHDKILTYLNIDDQFSISDSDNEQLKSITRFLDLIKIANDEKIYFENFMEAIKKLNESTSIEVMNVSNDCGNKRSSSQFYLGTNNDNCPFINDGDSYSTGDSGLDNETKIAQDYGNNIGKQNKKRIKEVRNLDLCRSGDTLKRYSQNLSGDFDETDFPNNLTYQKSFSHFPTTGLKSSYICDRRKSDFVTCASRRVNSYINCDDDDSKSCQQWTHCSGSATDLFYYDSMTDIKNKLDKLEQSMDDLQIISDESKHSRQKWMDENHHFKTKIHKLEDEIKQQKEEYDRNMAFENETSRKYLIKLEQSKTEEIDILNDRLRAKDAEIDSLKKELNALLGNCERMKYDKLRSEDKLADLQLQMNFIEEDMKRLKEFHSRELDLISKEKNRLLDTHNSDTNNANRQSNLVKSISTQQLFTELSKLRSENEELKSKLKMCEEEFLAFSIEQGHNILQSVPLDDSWMIEIDGYTKSEVIDLLVKEKDANFRLREYVSGILTRIIERDPSLLEIS